MSAAGAPGAEVEGLRTAAADAEAIGWLARALRQMSRARSDVIRQALSEVKARLPGQPAVEWHELALAFSRGREDRQAAAAVRAWQDADPLAGRFASVERFLQEGDRPLPSAAWTHDAAGEQGALQAGEYLSVWKLGGGHHVFARTLAEAGPVVVVDGVFKRYLGDDDVAFVEVETDEDVVRLSLGAAQIALGAPLHAVPVLLPGRFVPFRLAVLPGESWLFVDGVWPLRAPRPGGAPARALRFGVRAGARAMDANTFWTGMRVMAGARAPLTASDVAPVPALESHLVDLAAAWLACGRVARAAQLLLTATELRPTALVLENVERLARRLGDDLDTFDPRLQRALALAAASVPPAAVAPAAPSTAYASDTQPGPALGRAIGLDADGFARLRDVLALMDRARYDEARTALVAAADHHPGYPAFRHMLPAVLAALGDETGAVAAFRDLQADDPLHHRFARARAWMGTEGGPLPDAASGRVLEVSPAGMEPAPHALVVYKQQAGSWLFETPLAEGGGAVVFEAMARKMGGADEACVVELDWGTAKERVAVNGAFVVLKGGGQASRVRPAGRFVPFRVVAQGGEVRVYVDGAMLLRTTGLPAERPRAVRFGVAEGAEPVDTSSMWSSIRLAWDARPRVDHAALAPFPRFGAHLANVGMAWLELGNRERAFHCLGAALEIDPREEVVAGFETLVERIAADLDPADERLRRCVAAVEAVAGAARAEHLLTLVRQQRHEVAVSCRNVSIYFARAPHRVSHPLELAKRLVNPRRYFEKNYWWAIRDLSFDVRYGEVLAIIGNNGAGKSTLLRAIAGILDHEGEIVVNGDPRLLVMGLGVQDELTGRENVTLGCLYLGLRRREIHARTDEILEFAELTSFADTPYKYYSDGMKARLMFSIATSIEPDILLLDELLGAGDVTFRAKAMDRMNQLVERSKAMIVVTHNLAFVRDRARRALYLEGGRVVHYGDPHRAVDLYLDRSAPGAGGGGPDLLLEEV